MIEPYLLYTLGTILFVLGMIGYFKVASQYHIIDKPNERSSHVKPTVRGGGIIFVFAMLLVALQNDFDLPFFITGFFTVSIISFMDDIKEMSKRWRLGTQLISLTLLIYQVTQGELEWWQWAVFLVLAMSSVNFYNFMDGINGITAFYSLVFLGSCLYLQQTGELAVKEDLIVLPMLSVLVFSFFNARKRARCFAGDVGSVSMAFIVVYLVGLLCWQHQDFTYIWLLGIYGVDAVLTIFQRIMLGQNILQGHRLHLYQLMANEGAIPHVRVSAIYAIIQAMLNVFILGYIIPNQFDPVLLNIAMAVFFISIYVPIKYGFGKKLERSAKKHGKTQSMAG
ncbi:MAG: glycosyltransferase family 4 protein [Roseivirga sp.]